MFPSLPKTALALIAVLAALPAAAGLTRSVGGCSGLATSWSVNWWSITKPLISRPSTSMEASDASISYLMEDWTVFYLISTKPCGEK